MIRRLIFFLSLFLSDLLSVVLSFDVALELRKLIGPWEISRSRLTFLGWILFVFVFIAGLHKGLYVRRLPFWFEVKECWSNVLVSMISVFAFLSISKVWYVSRLFLLLWTLLLLVVLPLMRYWTKIVMHRFNVYRDNLLILGANQVGVKAGEYILKEPTMGYNLVGFLDDSMVGREIEIRDKKFKVLSRIKKFSRISKILNVGTIMVALPDFSEDELVKLVNRIHMASRKVLFVPGIKGLALLNAEIIPPFMDNFLLVHLRNNLMYSRNHLIKRAFDVVVSFLGLLLLLPLFGVIALLVKISSPGPIIYKQRRVGKAGREFWVYKFRTMYKDAEVRLNSLLEKDKAVKNQWQETRKIPNDPRITPLGRFLRRTSLDELPQLFNVLKGDMSLVGPRPVTKEEIREYYKDAAYYYYMVRPGITGLWQVSGRSDTDYQFRIETDVWYVLNWSLWLDVMILFKTIWVVLRGKGAY